MPMTLSPEQARRDSLRTRNVPRQRHPRGRRILSVSTRRTVGFLAASALSVLLCTAMQATTGLRAETAQATDCPFRVTCSGAATSPGGIDIWAGIRYPASPGRPGTPGSGTSSGGSTRPTAARPPTSGNYHAPTCSPLVASPWYCTPERVPPVQPVPEIPELNLADLRHFVPETPTISTEPSGWSVLGLPTNMLAGARQHTVTGVVLGWQVDVAFTPVHYLWSFGDGAQRDTVDAGSSWAARLAAEFSSTATSHIYERLGVFEARVSAYYRASYRFSGYPWRSVSGEISVASAPVQVVISTFSRALVSSFCVDRHCTEGG